MLSYETALKLKDAGFPQGIKGYYYDYLGNEIEPHWSDLVLETYIYVPTLSELIEACGNDFYSLIRGQGGTFATCDINGNVNALSNLSPEEAVASLWLAINKK